MNHIILTYIFTLFISYILMFYINSFEIYDTIILRYFHRQERGFSRTDLWFPGGRILLFLMVTILHRELKRKVKKVKYSEILAA